MRFGLIGAGGIGKIRAEAIAKSPVCELVAVSDLDETRARTAAPGAKYYADANDVIAAQEVDAIIISTPPPLHEPLAIAAAKAGKHVLVEKPMAATPEACERMIAAALAAGTLLTVGYNHRYFEALKLASRRGCVRRNREAVSTSAPTLATPGSRNSRRRGCTTRTSWAAAR